jgi:MarR family transcriptional regulator, temperature-dependent positive regulator of motility
MCTHLLEPNRGRVTARRVIKSRKSPVPGTRAAVAASARLEPGLERLHGIPGHLIRRAHQIATSIFAEEQTALGITPIQFAVLFTLAEHPGIDQITLAGLTALDAANAGSVIARLEERGYVSRSPAVHDRRSKLLYLTPAGRELTELALAGSERTSERLLEPLDVRERETLLELLAKLVGANNSASRAPFRPKPNEANRPPKRG